MEKYYLAIDIGASSGRHMLSSYRNGIMETQEVYRFPNGMVDKEGTLCWDLDRLFTEIVTGMRQCKELGKIPVSVGIDTWAVDFVLLDQDNKILGNSVAYRDSRTKDMDQKVYDAISFEELYSRTGIQKQIFNTIYQLMAIKERCPEHMNRAQSLLMIPDYFNFLLTEAKATEYTNATTTQLVSPITKDWDYELIHKLGYPSTMFTKIVPAGTKLGRLSENVKKEVGFDCEVILPATHDTASAVLAVPSNEEHVLYLSSGTWSLMGVELENANCSLEGMEKNLTNEGGYDYRFRYLKNIMGLWMIQSVRQEYKQEYSFEQLGVLAEENKEFPSLVDVNDDSFLAPKSMINAIQDYCRATNQPVPQKVGEISAVIYHSLVKSYKETVKELEQITGVSYSSIHIVGGGSNADYLNRLTARATGKTVYAGPAEATAIGNITAQMLEAKVFKTVAEARTAIFHSFEIKRYQV